LWHNERVPDTPTSAELRGEAEKLRETATELMEYAALLIAKSIELEKWTQGRNKPKSRS